MIPNRLSHSASNGLKPAEISPILVDYDALNSQVVQQVLDDADDKDLELIHEALEKAFGNQENWTDVRKKEIIEILSGFFFPEVHSEDRYNRHNYQGD